MDKRNAPIVTIINICLRATYLHTTTLQFKHNSVLQLYLSGHRATSYSSSLETVEVTVKGDCR
jgi:hypothetical protein